MKYRDVAIAGWGLALPPEKISSSQIEEMLAPVYTRLKLPEGRLELQTGIQTRGMWPRGTRPSLIATTAARDALRRFSHDPSEIDLLIHASVCRDFLEPSTASVVHEALGLSSSCAIFDLSNACLGVVSAMTVAASMIEQGSIRRALIVSGENGGPLLLETIERLNRDMSLTRQTIKKYIANLTIGSAGVAVILSRADLASSAPRLLGGAVRTDSTANVLCQGDGNPESLMMETDSEALLQAGVTLAKATWEETKTVLDWTNGTPDCLIGHQVGVAHRERVLGSLGLDKQKDFSTFPEFGNTGSAALPLTMGLAVENGKIQKGQRVALLGIGSGLTSVMLGVQW